MKRWFAALLLTASSLAQETNERPNILWITLEDTSPHFIGCYGNAAAKTPHINPLFPALRSGPTTASGAARQKQITSSR